MHINRKQPLNFTTGPIFSAGFPFSARADGLCLENGAAPGSVWWLARPGSADDPLARGPHPGGRP